MRYNYYTVTHETMMPADKTAPDPVLSCNDDADDRDVVGIVSKFRIEGLFEAKTYGEQRCGSICEQTVVVTAAVASPVARVIEGQPRHQRHVNISERDLGNVVTGLAQPKGARYQLVFLAGMQRQASAGAISHARPDQLR